MPFITEELWQRLRFNAAAAAAGPISIMICEYPSMVGCWKNEQVENEMENVIMLVVNSLRSLAKESRERRAAFVLCGIEEERELMSRQCCIIEKLANVSPLEIIDEEGAAPTGWAGSQVNDNLTVYLEILG